MKCACSDLQSPHEHIHPFQQNSLSTCMQFSVTITLVLLTAISALNVEELLHADVSPEPRLRHDEAVSSNQLESQTVGQDGRVAVGDVRKRPGVNEHRSALYGRERTLPHARGYLTVVIIIWLK